MYTDKNNINKATHSLIFILNAGTAAS